VNKHHDDIDAGATRSTAHRVSGNIPGTQRSAAMGTRYEPEKSSFRRLRCKPATRNSRVQGALRLNPPGNFLMKRGSVFIPELRGPDEISIWTPPRAQGSSGLQIVRIECVSRLLLAHFI
jgi:hypothetical protein